jgi:hypothetical protein
VCKTGSTLQGILRTAVVLVALKNSDDGFLDCVHCPEF